MTRKEEYAVMLAAINLMNDHVGKNGVTLNLAEALISALRIKPRPGYQTERYHFNCKVEKAGEVATLLKQDYFKWKKRIQDSGAGDQDPDDELTPDTLLPLF